MVGTVPWDRVITSGLVYLARIVERMDEQLLPSVYFYVGCAFHASPSQLGTITLCRVLVQALASPVGGILGHLYNRAYVISAGCAIWAVFTAVFSVCTTIEQGMMVWAFNGLGLAWMIPNGQSLIADLYDNEHRGTAFGALLCTGALGGMLGSLYATNIAGLRILGLEGWRFAFITVAALSGGLALAIALLVDDPRCPKRCLRVPHNLVFAVHRAEAGHTGQGGEGCGFLVPLLNASDEETPREEADQDKEQALLLGAAEQSLKGADSVLEEAWGAMRWVLTVPSFIVIVAQGMLGSTPRNALVFFTLYLQLLGFSDGQAGGLWAVFLVGDAAGALLGGWVGDLAARHWPDHGRITVCQFSVAIGVPLCAVLLKGLPTTINPGNVMMYGGLLLATGLLTAWPAPACNNPIFAEIVPEKLRSLVYAFDRAFEGAVAALGAPLVGILAERVFHFKTAVSSHGCDPASAAGETRRDLGKAAALGSALTVLIVVPWVITTLVFNFLHCTYPRDRRRAAAAQLAEEQAAALVAGTRRGGSGGPRGDDVAAGISRLGSLAK